MVRPAGQRGAALELVAAVPAVVVAVAHVAGGQALPVGAHKLTTGTGFGVWGSGIEGGKKKKKEQNTNINYSQTTTLIGSLLAAQGC